MSKSFLLAVVIALFPMIAAGLTIEEIETRWGSTRNVSGTFTEVYADGSRGTGTFTLANAGHMMLSYENGTRVIIQNGRFQVNDPHGEPFTHNLGPLRKLFSTQPDLEEIVTGSGSSESHTTIRLRDPLGRVAGYVDVTFENASGKLVRWDNRTNGENIRTSFHY